MLIRFIVDNFKSIKDTLELSLVSGSTNKMGNTIKAGKLELLPSAVIYGANASGKTNVLEAFATMQRIVLNKDKTIQPTDRFPYNPFRLCTETELSPTVFDIVFMIDDVEYEYGFTYDSEIVYAEWLTVLESGIPTRIFEFDIDTGYIYNDEVKDFKAVHEKNNSLYLWELDRREYKYAVDVLAWFGGCSYVLFNKGNSFLSEEFSHELLKPGTREFLSKLLREADLGIEGIDSIDVRDGKLKVSMLRKKYDQDGNAVGISPFDLDEDESSGTQRLFGLIEPISKAIRTGCPLFVDELDSNLHPGLVEKILFSIFHDSSCNSKSAQIIFTTRDTSFLDLNIMHESQIWFAEKDKYGATTLISLVEYKGVRDREYLQKDYKMGRYGGVPYLGDFSGIIRES